MTRPDGQPPSSDDDAEEPTAVERWILPYFEDSSLWPILLVVLAHMVAFLVPVILFALRDRHMAGIAAAGILVYGSIRAIHWEWRQRSRPGPISGLLVTVWVLGGVAAYYADRTGLF